MKATVLIYELKVEFPGSVALWFAAITRKTLPGGIFKVDSVIEGELL